MMPVRPGAFLAASTLRAALDLYSLAAFWVVAWPMLQHAFSLEEVACLGACSIAPVVKVGEEIVGNVQVRDVERLLSDARARAAAKGGDDD